MAEGSANDDRRDSTVSFNRLVLAGRKQLGARNPTGEVCSASRPKPRFRRHAGAGSACRGNPRKNHRGSGSDWSHSAADNRNNLWRPSVRVYCACFRTSNIAFANVEAEALLVMLDQVGICASSGSACTTGSLVPSHVLTAMGISTAHARRVSASALASIPRTTR